MASGASKHISIQDNEQDQWEGSGSAEGEKWNDDEEVEEATLEQWHSVREDNWTEIVKLHNFAAPVDDLLLPEQEKEEEAKEDE